MIPAWQTRARVRVVGLGPATNTSACASLAAAALEVDYRPFANARFTAWSVDNTQCVATSASVGFTVPLRVDSGLKFSVLQRATGETTESRQSFALSMGADATKTKLVPGTYVIAFRRPATGKLPNLTAYQLRADGQDNPTDGAVRHLYAFNKLRGRIVPADFPYIIFTVASA